MDDLPVNLIIAIMKYMYPLHIDTYIKFNLTLKYNNYKKLYKQRQTIMNLSVVCKYFYNIVNNYGLKVLYFNGNVNISIINKYTSICLIAPNDRTLTDDKIKLLTNLTHIDLSDNENITDEGIKHLTNLIYLYLVCNTNITDEGIKPLINLTYLYLFWNENITDVGIKPLINLTSLRLEMNEKITYEGIKHLTKLKKCYTTKIRKN